MSTQSTQILKAPTRILGEEENFLGLDEAHSAYAPSHFVIQQVPYEHTSSYLKGSAKGPAAMVEASHYVEFYDEVLSREACFERGICTLAPYQISETDEKAMDTIARATSRLLADDKFVVSLGGEHTVTLGFVKAHAEVYPNLSVLQLDAHSDLRTAYHGNPYSHASVMARVHELGLNICQVGIRAQCREEAELIKSTSNIHTFYAHQLRSNPDWMNEAISSLSDHIYITIDADAFDPSVIPAVGTAEPGGMYWEETVTFLSRVVTTKNVVGFDVVEVAPQKGEIRSQYTLAKLIYRIIGLISAKL